MADAAIAEVRRLLEKPVERASPGGLLLAAAMAALGAVLMAGVMILGPGVNLEDQSSSEATAPSAQFPHG